MYLSGLEANPGPLDQVASVASFFVSRVDAAIDASLTEIGTPEALALRGKAAVANAQVAYERFLERFSGPRWEALVARGARLQRPLWASTSTKNPDYPPTLYVDADRPRHGEHHARGHARGVRGRWHRRPLTADADLAGAHAVLDALAGLGSTSPRSPPSSRTRAWMRSSVRSTA